MACKLNVMCLGDTVGRTSLMDKLIQDYFTEEYSDLTIG